MSEQRLVQSGEDRTLSGCCAATVDHWDGGIGNRVLHCTIDIVGCQRLQRFRCPGGHKGGVVSFPIVGICVGRVVVLGNHNGQRRANCAGHHRARIVDMLRPVVDMRDANILCPGVIASIFVPAHDIRTRVSLLQEGLQITAVVLEVDRPDKASVGCQLLQLGDKAVP